MTFDAVDLCMVNRVFIPEIGCGKMFVSHVILRNDTNTFLCYVKQSDILGIIGI